MSFWRMLFRRPCVRQLAAKAENIKLEEAINEHHKALKQANDQIERVKQTTAALEVAAEALTAVSRGKNGAQK